MPDMDKVIKALEHCSEDGCEGCPYEPDCLMADGFSELARDALELLKTDNGTIEQYKFERDVAIDQLKEIGKGFAEKMDDIVEVLEKHESKTVIVEGSDVAHVGRCPSCHVILTPFRANYCYCCGKAVNWDAAD